MKVFQDFISKLHSTEKHENIFGNLCMKKGGSFQKERFSFLLKSSMRGVLTPEPPGAYATESIGLPKMFAGRMFVTSAL